MTRHTRIRLFKVRPMPQTRMYSTVEAAEYLGIHPQVLRYHIYTKKHLAADQTIGRELAFSQATLDEFKTKHQTGDGLTLKEAADYLGVERRVLYYHFRDTKKLVPIGKRGTSWVFSIESLDALRPQLRQDEPK